MPVIDVTEPIFQVPDYARLRNRLISFHSLNPFANHDSSPRLTMLYTQFCQSVVLNNSEEKIVQSGLDHQLGENTFSIKIEHDCRVVGVVERYRSLGSTTEPIEILLFVENIDSGEFDVYSIPYYLALHQYFGFKYKTDKKWLLSLKKGELLPKGLILADSPGVKENSGYGFGANVNTILLTDPSTSEDGVVVSESFAKKINFNTFETRTISFGSDKLLLNTYGNDEEYKGFPAIGEMINPDSIIAVLRKNQSTIGFALTSKEDLKRFTHGCDEPIFTPGPGKEIVNEDGSITKSGVIVDIKAWENPKYKNKNNYFPLTVGDTQKHVNALRNFFKDVLEVYVREIRSCLKDNIKKSRNVRPDGTIKMTPTLHKLIIEAFAIGDPMGRQLPLNRRKATLDRFQVEFIIQYTHNLSIGSKLTGTNGDKGVVVAIRPDKYMPHDANGKCFDIMMDPTSIISRMNLGRLYEQYFTAASRVARDQVRDILNKNPNDKKKAWNVVLSFLAIIGTEQYDWYKKANPDEVDVVLNDIMERELFIYYHVGAKKPAYIIVHELEKSPFKPLKAPCYIRDRNDNIRQTKMSVLGGPIYHMVLSKMPSGFLSAVSSSFLNHFGFPIGPSSSRKFNFHIKPNPVRVVSETEFRCYLAYGTPEAIAEIKSRANSIDDHKTIYRKILDTDKNGFIDDLIPRDENPYGTDSVLKILDSIFKTMGFKQTYIDDGKQYNPLAIPSIGFKKNVKKKSK